MLEHQSVIDPVTLIRFLLQDENAIVWQSCKREGEYRISVVIKAVLC